jgi:hypothetical protein
MSGDGFGGHYGQGTNNRTEGGSGVEFVALGAWILAAVVGTYLMVVEAAQGGLFRQATKVTRFPVLVTIGHPAVAMAGLAAWVAHLVTERAWYAWAAFAALVVVIFQGFLLFTRWLVGQDGGRHAKETGQRFPATAVVVHALAATVTLVLVVLTAVRIGAR